MSMEATNPPEVYKRTFHPNRIGVYGAAIETTSYVAERLADTYGVGPIVGKVIGTASDVIDGKVARAYPDHLKTKEGARLDPLLDKYRTYVTAAFVLAQSMNPYVALSYLANLAVDVKSTLKRGPLDEQLREAYRAFMDPESCTIDNEETSSTRAGTLGKVKASLQNIAGIQLVSAELVENLTKLADLELNRPVYDGVGATMLAVSAVVGYIGQKKR